MGRDGNSGVAQESSDRQNRYGHRLSQFRVLDLFILTTLIAIGVTGYRWLKDQPIDFWLIIYAQTVFMSIVALVTAFIVLRLSEA